MMRKKRFIAIVVVVIMLTALLPASALAHSGTYDEHDHTNYVQFIKVEIKAGNNGGIYSPGGQNIPSQGDTWTFTAVPDSGYVFDHWTYSGNEVSGAFSTSGADGEVLSVNISQKGGWVSAVSTKKTSLKIFI